MFTKKDSSVLKLTYYHINTLSNYQNEHSKTNRKRR